jgi:acyl-CoA thioester hydrolase
VRFHECDPQGVVFNANFLAYADIAVTELYREAFGSWQQAMDSAEIDMVVAEANARFLAPVRFDEELELVTTLTRIGETSTTTEVSMERDGKPAALVTLRHVVIDIEARTKAAIPPGLRAGLERYQASAT